MPLRGLAAGPGLPKQVQSLPFFTLGMLASGVFLGLAMHRIGRIRDQLASALPDSARAEATRTLNRRVTAFGIVNAGAVGVFGFVPWSHFVLPHIGCALFIFLGGGGWALGNAVLLERFRALDPAGAYSSLRALQWIFLAVLAVDLPVMLFYIFRGGVEPLVKVFHTLQTDWDTYCAATFGPEYLVGMVAEWVLIALLIFSVGTVHADLDLHQDLSQEKDV
jgi:hypothetical protein